jgi:hypothetical protein
MAQAISAAICKPLMAFNFAAHDPERSVYARYAIRRAPRRRALVSTRIDELPMMAATHALQNEYSAACSCAPQTMSASLKHGINLFHGRLSPCLRIKAFIRLDDCVRRSKLFDDPTIQPENLIADFFYDCHVV